MQLSLAKSLSLAIAIWGVAARVPKDKNADPTYQGQTQVQNELQSGGSRGGYPSQLFTVNTGDFSGIAGSVSGSTPKVLARSSPEKVVIVTPTTSAEYSATTSEGYPTSSGASKGYYKKTPTTTSRPTGACATPIINPGFELKSPPTHWKRQYPNPETPYHFRATSNVTNPHSGEQCAEVLYKKGAIGYETWFNQHISLCEKTLYNFTSYTKVSKEGTGCSVRYQIADHNGTTLAGLVGLSSQDLTTEWLEGKATYLSGEGIDAAKAAIDVRINCYGSATEDRAWYFDDISLVAV